MRTNTANTTEIIALLGISGNTFDDRMLAQNKIYLLQELGVDLGFSFSWFPQGPFSRDLDIALRDVEQRRNPTAQDEFEPKMPEFVKKQIRHVNQLAPLRPTQLSVGSWYALLATTLFVTVKTGGKDIPAEMQKYAPGYHREHIAMALGRLRQMFEARISGN